MPPPVAVTVIADVPRAASAAAVMVMVELPEPGAATTDGLKDAVTPAGRLLTESDRAELNPATARVVTVTEVEVPGTSWTEEGADIEKSGTGQPLTRLAAFTVPIPVAKSQPTVVP